MPHDMSDVCEVAKGGEVDTWCWYQPTLIENNKGTARFYVPNRRTTSYQAYHAFTSYALLKDFGFYSGIFRPEFND